MCSQDSVTDKYVTNFTDQFDWFHHHHHHPEYLQEFVQLYKILLPKGLQSGKVDVSHFLESMNMNSDNYQIGKTKVSSS